MADTGMDMNVFTVAGVPPEILAVAMARYSRSNKGLLAAIQEATAGGTTRFLEENYLSYGHKSIADMAHIPFGIENISILAAIQVEDEQLWDGQERSTRYQSFDKSAWIIPADLPNELQRSLNATCTALFRAYHETTRMVIEVIKRIAPKPDDMDDGLYQRTVRARTFDVSRCLLPLATRTSVGQIVSARTLEGQVGRLLADERGEVRLIGRKLLDAATKAFPTIGWPYLDEQCEEAQNYVRDNLLIYPAPTLMRHARESWYTRKIRTLCNEAVAYIKDTPSYADDESWGPPDHGEAVRLESATQGGDVTALSALLYRGFSGQRTYDDCLVMATYMIRGWGQNTGALILNDLLNLRESHDELPREMRTGYGYQFDIFTDIGSFRDFHRHRRCVQIIPEFNPDLDMLDVDHLLLMCLGEEGRDLAVNTMGLRAYMQLAMSGALNTAVEIARDYPAHAPYFMPLGAKCRFLMRMDLAEAMYIAELRTKPGGHPLYRETAYTMWQEVVANESWLKGLARVTAVHPMDPITLLSR